MAQDARSKLPTREYQRLAGEHLCHLKEKYNKKRADISKGVGKSLRQVDRYLKGEATIKLEDVPLWAKALGCHEEEVLPPILFRERHRELIQLFDQLAPSQKDAMFRFGRSFDQPANDRAHHH